MATATANHAQNKTAIIVGASRGLGLGLAREFARRGWQVTATARSAAAATELADEVAASDGGIAVEEVDLDRPESVDALATRLAGRRFGLVFINAGVAGPQHQSADIATPQEVGALMYTNAARRSASRVGSAAHCRRWHARLHVLEHGLGRRQSVGWHGALSGKQGGAQLADSQLRGDRCRRPANCGVEHASRLGHEQPWAAPMPRSPSRRAWLG